MNTALIIIIILNMILIMRIEDLHTKIKDLNNDVDHLHNRVIRYGEGKSDLEEAKKIRGIIDEVNK
jgi:hypothetical protein